jgi:hypothetical protein
MKIIKHINPFLNYHIGLTIMNYLSTSTEQQKIKTVFFIL